MKSTEVQESVREMENKKQELNTMRNNFEAIQSLINNVLAKDLSDVRNIKDLELFIDTQIKISRRISELQLESEYGGV